MLLSAVCVSVYKVIDWNSSKSKWFAKKYRGRLMICIISCVFLMENWFNLGVYVCSHAHVYACMRLWLWCRILFSKYIHVRRAKIKAITFSGEKIPFWLNCSRIDWRFNHETLWESYLDLLYESLKHFTMTKCQTLFSYIHICWTIDGIFLAKTLKWMWIHSKRNWAYFYNTINSISSYSDALS